MATIRLSGVSVEFPIYHAGGRSMRRFAIEAARSLRIRMDAGRATVRALDSIDLEVGVGERLAIVGPNGAGKSTLLRTMAGIYMPTAGTIVRTGRVTPLLSLGMGLNMEASGRDNILLLAMHLDIRPGVIRPLVDEIVEWTELGAFIDAPLRTYSAGMVMRLAFAVSTAVAPDILILDEWLAIGDVAFQRKAQERMAEFVGATSLLVLASHAPDLLRLWCNRAVRLDAGRIVGEGPIDDVLAEPQPDGRTPASGP